MIDQFMVLRACKTRRCTILTVPIFASMSLRECCALEGHQAISDITGRAHGIDVCDSAGVVAEATTSSETGDGPRGTYPPGCPAMALGPASLEAQGHGVPLKDTDLLWISPCRCCCCCCCCCSCRCCWRTYVLEYTSAFPQRLVWWINPLLYTRPLRPCHTP